MYTLSWSQGKNRTLASHRSSAQTAKWGKDYGTFYIII